MVARAKIRALGNAHVVADRDLSEVVDPAIFTKPRIVSNA
jgi:hypothetical protein